MDTPRLNARQLLYVTSRPAYDRGMRYAQRGGYTPAEQQRRERLRLEARDLGAYVCFEDEAGQGLAARCSSGTRPGCWARSRARSASANKWW